MQLRLQRPLRFRLRRQLRQALLSALCCLGACLSLAATGQGEAYVPSWPSAPAATRVVFVGAFSRAEDLGISRSLFARLADFLFGAVDSSLQRPMAVVAHEGVIHVADPGAGGIHRFDTRGGGYAWVTGPGGEALPSPVGLARGEGGNVYITDSARAAVFLIGPGETKAVRVSLQAPLTQPTGIAYDRRTGRLLVADTGAHTILIFNRQGELLGRLGQRGAGPGEFNFPTYITLTGSGGLYVNDSLNYRIQAFDAQGRFTASFGRQGDGIGDAFRQKGVGVDSMGHLYVVDALLHSVQVFDPAGRLLLPVGEQGQQPGEFWLPTGIFIDTSDRDTIYVADAFNHRIQVLRYVGGAD